MKIIATLAISLWLCATAAFAAEQTLITGELEHGGYGSPVIRFTTINNDFAVMVGGQGGWIINHKLVLGVGGYGLVTDHDMLSPDYKNKKLGMGYGGFFLGYVDNSDRIAHPACQILIGAGSIEERDQDGDDSWDDPNNNDAFFVVEPQMGLEVNLTYFMRMELSMGYRWVNGVERFGYTDSDIGGPSGSLTIKFGRF